MLSAGPAAAAPGSLAPHLRHPPGPQPPRPGRRPRAVAGARPDRAAARPVPDPGAARRGDRRGGQVAAGRARRAGRDRRLQRARRPAAHGRSGSRAIGRARAQPERALPAVSARPSDGPPPAHRWPERDPDAATRLTAVRAVVAALADEHHLPAENLLPPDAVRRLAWQPPEPTSAEAVGRRAGRVRRPALAGRARPRCRSPGRCCGSPRRARRDGASGRPGRGWPDGDPAGFGWTRADQLPGPRSAPPRRFSPDRSGSGAAAQRPEVARRRRAARHPAQGRIYVALGVVGKDVEDHLAVAAAAAAPLQRCTRPRARGARRSRQRTVHRCVPSQPNSLIIRSRKQRRHSRSPGSVNRRDSSASSASTASARSSGHIRAPFRQCLEIAEFYRGHPTFLAPPPPAFPTGEAGRPGPLRLRNCWPKLGLVPSLRTIQLAWATLGTPVGPLSAGCSAAGLSQVRFGPPPAGQAGQMRPGPVRHARAAAPGAGAGAEPAPPVTSSPSTSGGRRRLRPADRLDRDVAAAAAGARGAVRDRRLRRDGQLRDAGPPGPVRRPHRGPLPARAVGRIMGSNPIPVIVPCHRVVAADGLGGYSGGHGPGGQALAAGVRGRAAADARLGRGRDLTGLPERPAARHGSELGRGECRSAPRQRGPVGDVQHPEAGLGQRQARGRHRAEDRAGGRQQRRQVLPVRADDGGHARRPPRPPPTAAAGSSAAGTSSASPIVNAGSIWPAVVPVSAAYGRTVATQRSAAELITRPGAEAGQQRASTSASAAPPASSGRSRSSPGQDGLAAGRRVPQQDQRDACRRPGGELVQHRGVVRVAEPVAAPRAPAASPAASTSSLAWNAGCGRRARGAPPSSRPAWAARRSGTAPWAAAGRG